jgi:selenocysteine-specific elongation factor
MPQTQEHLQILGLMGLRHGLVALTKIDLVDATRRVMRMDDVRRLLSGTFLAEAPICPVSNVSGEGYDHFFDTLNAVVGACDDRACAGLFRVWVEDVFTIRGAGTVVTGIPTHGWVEPGAVLRLFPAGVRGRLRRLEVYGEPAVAGRAGECVALNLPELDQERVRRGMVLCESDALEPVTICEAELQLLNVLTAPIRDGIELHLHVGTASVLTRVALLEQRQMAPGESQLVQLHLTEPLAVVVGERFVVRANIVLGGRSGLATIGGGRILGVGNVRLRRRKPWTIDRLTARREALESPVRWVEQMVRESATPWTHAEVQRRSLLRAAEANELIGRLQATGRLLSTAGGKLIHAAVVDERAAGIVAAVEAFHGEHVDQAGMVREALAVKGGGDDEVLTLALARLVRDGEVTFNGVVVARAGWRPCLSDPDRELSERVAGAYQRSGWVPPTATELSEVLRVSRERVLRSVQLLQERGVLVRLDDRWMMHRDAIAAGQQAVLGLFRKAPSFTTMQFRDALGVSRKHAVPLLDHLDRIRFTVRSGHDRTPGVEATKRLGVGG